MSKVKPVVTVTKALVPKDYLRGPVFAARPQKGGRMVQIADRVYEIGGFSPLDAGPICPALDMRHGRACFTMLSFREFGGGDTIKFSINAFCRKYAASQGGRYARDVRRILSDLLSCYIRVHNRDGSDSTYRIIERVEITRRPPRRKPKDGGPVQKEFWLDEVKMSPEFHKLLLDISELAHLRLDVLNHIASPIAQAIYTYLPSRAVHHKSKADAFEINLSTLLQQIGQPVPPAKSQRRQVFLQHANTKAGSIVAQLNGIETTGAHVLRVDLAETADGKDYKLLTWVEPRPAAALGQPKASKEVGRPPRKLMAAWLASGGTEEGFRELMQRQADLTDYERELLTAGRIAVEGSEPFFRMAKTLLGEARFDILLGEAKGVILEDQAVTNPTGLLIARLLEAIGNQRKSG